MNWRDLFKPKVIYKTVYKVIEVDAPRTPRRWDKETREAVATLNSHPGFIALRERLASQQAAIKSTLNRSLQKDLRSVDFLQSGVFWTGWIQAEVDRATLKGPEKQFDPLAEELEAFQAIDSQIERICENQRV